MLIKTNNKKKLVGGFTLVETIVVIFIFTILAIGTSTLFTHIFTSSQDRLNAIDNIDQATAVANKFINEVRVASVGVTGAYPLGQTDDSQTIIYSDYGQAGGTVAKIRYYLATTTLYKGVTIPSGSPLTYNPAQEKIQTVQTDIASGSAPIFYYYDGNYNGSSTPLAQPVNATQVKYIRINLNILKQNTRSDASTFNVSTGASIRNLKTNLGN